MKPLLDRISSGEVILVDGAMGTMLMQRGLSPGQCPEAFGLEHPKVLQEIATHYRDAGADILETNTFGASPLKLAQYKLEHRTEDINRAAAQAVRSVARDSNYVAACIGPSGKILKPYGDTEPQSITDSIVAQASCLIDEGVDCVCVETMIDLKEATLAVEAVRAVSAEVPITATMTFDATPRGFFTVMGTDIEHAAKGLMDAGANVVGSNCGNGIENMIKIAEAFRACTDIPIIIQSNAGLPETKGDQVVWGESPEFMAHHAAKLLDLGVSVIGGCCGTTPDHIRALRKLIDERAAA